MHTVSWHRLSSPHSLNALGSSRMLKSTSRTEPLPPPHTHDAAPVKSKVALWLTASQGIDYHSTAHTVYLSHHQGGHCHCTGHRTIVDTLYVVITAQVPLHISTSPVFLLYIRYLMFIKLKKLYPHQILIPMYDIDLIWHSHQLCTEAYERDTINYLGEK